MRRYLKYLSYVLRHKWFVFVAACKLGIPWLGLIHDLSKFSPSEWFAYARTFYKPNGEKQYIESVEFARAWMLHQHRNKHHWQYWIGITVATDNFGMRLPESNYLVWDRGEAQRVVERNSGPDTWYELRPAAPGDRISYDAETPMPDKYRREMLADWIGAGKALGKPDTKAWYMDDKQAAMRDFLHPETRAWVEQQLGVSVHA